MPPSEDPTQLSGFVGTAASATPWGSNVVPVRTTAIVSGRQITDSAKSDPPTSVPRPDTPGNLADVAGIRGLCDRCG